MCSSDLTHTNRSLRDTLTKQRGEGDRGECEGFIPREALQCVCVCMCMCVCDGGMVCACQGVYVMVCACQGVYVMVCACVNRAGPWCVGPRACLQSHAGTQWGAEVGSTTHIHFLPARPALGPGLGGRAQPWSPPPPGDQDLVGISFSHSS